MEKIFQEHFKYCPTCKERKRIDNFHINRSMKDGLNRICKECERNRKNKYKAVYNEEEKMPFDWIWNKN